MPTAFENTLRAMTSPGPISANRSISNRQVPREMPVPTGIAAPGPGNHSARREGQDKAAFDLGEVSSPLDDPRCRPNAASG